METTLVCPICKLPVTDAQSIEYTVSPDGDYTVTHTAAFHRELPACDCECHTDRTWRDPLCPQCFGNHIDADDIDSARGAFAR